MVRVAAVTNAFRCARWLPGAVKQFENAGIDHLILCNSTSWNGGLANDEETMDAAVETGAEVVFGDWRSAKDQFNYALELFENRRCDWALLVDADERWTAEGVRALIRDMETTDYSVIRPASEVRYWRTPYWTIEPAPTYDRAYVAFRTHLRVKNIRWPGSARWKDCPATLHHFSYVRTDEEMLDKITANDDYRDRDHEKLLRWYRERWLGWTPEMTNLHPVHPSQFVRAVYAPAPPELFLLL